MGQYTGDMNLDFWPRDKWYDEFNKHQVLILTSQIFVNLVNNNFMGKYTYNLMFFKTIEFYIHQGVTLSGGPLFRSNI